jgi:hypothetical protein
MSMKYEEALQLKEEIEQTHPELTCDVREMAGVWVVDVNNPRTNEQFGIVHPATWQDRLSNMEGGIRSSQR